MKQIIFFLLLLLVTLSSCGQKKHDDMDVSEADKAKVKFYEQRSSFYQRSRPDSALYFVERGLKLSRRLHYRFGEALLLDRFARINEEYGNLKLALRHQVAALRLFNELKDTKAVATATVHLALLEGRLGKRLKAQRLISNVLGQYEKSGDTAGMISAGTALGELYELSGQKDKAINCYLKTIALNKGKPVTDEFFTLLGSMARLYEQLGNKQKARAYHQQSLEKAKELGLAEEVARSEMGIAGTLENGQTDQSIIRLKNALAIANTIGHKQLSADIYQSLSDVYKQQSRYREALRALETHHRLLDSMLLLSREHKIAVLQSNYDLAESRLHIETLELANKRKTYQRNVGIMIAITALSVLGILVIYFYKVKRLNKRLAASKQINDKLFSIIGHDLRNPIGSITQVLKLMENRELDKDEQEGLIVAVRKQSEATQDTLNALLGWGETQLKGIKVKPVSFDARILVEKNIALLQGQAKDKKIEITAFIPQDLYVYGDADHFDFIVRNLLSNAIKFSYPLGKVVVSTHEDDLKGKVVFAVKDEGTGISGEQQQQFLKSGMDSVFGTAGEKGTGIGLVLCKEFVRANHGKLWLESKKGLGTTFYFYFELNS
jgi:signal transduction histidine kinase